MPKPMVRIHNTETNEVIDRQMTDAEYEIYLQEQTIAAQNKQNYLDRITAREAAEAKLAALGLTTDDLKALGL
jgi:hypothetical protein